MAKRRKKLLVPVSEDTSAVESFEMVSDADPDTDYYRSDTDVGFVRLQNLEDMASDSDLFSFVHDELEDPATRREKIKVLMTELRTLDAKLMGQDPVGGESGPGSGQSSLEREAGEAQEEVEVEVIPDEPGQPPQGGIILSLFTVGQHCITGLISAYEILYIISDILYYYYIYMNYMNYS